MWVSSLSDHIMKRNSKIFLLLDFALKVLNWDHNTIIRLQLWDIAGSIDELFIYVKN